MPEMDGFEATGKIREQEKKLNKGTHTPIIALTADVQKGIVEQCLDAGMDAYLSKPFNSKQLQKALEKWLSLESEEQEQTPSTHITLPAPLEAKILNAEAIDELRQLTTETGETLLSKAVALFLNTAPKAVSDMQEALDQKNSIALTKLAHSFKSTCANLGAQNLADSSASIEAISKQGHTQGVDDLLKEISSNLPEVINALNQELDADIPAASIINESLDHTVPKGEQCRILLVDDDLSFRLITSAALTASSFIVDQAESGQKALEKIKQHKPDIIMLDAIMDDLDGFETCKILRKDSALADIPIIMSTGLGDIDSIHRAFDSGATDFMVKPLSYPILIQRLWFISP
jgi:CheY-like chemotaxis protein/HPt (histidine-containing phosphotransfer) domain-containing protein